MKNISWTIEKRKVADLKEADYNPRKMTEQEERDLDESIGEFGAVIPVVVNIGKRENVLIGGHQRTRLYLKRGIKDVDVMVPSRELTITEEKRLNLRLNKNVGSWDQEKLRDMGLNLLLDVGFGDEDLQVFFDDVDVIDDDHVPGGGAREIKNPKARTGDVYLLGQHMLMCGDASNPAHVKTLMGGESADMIFCDPPPQTPSRRTRAEGEEGKERGGHIRKLPEQHHRERNGKRQAELPRILLDTGTRHLVTADTL